MQKRYWFFIVMVWAGLIASILADCGDIIATILGLETSLALGNILFHILQIIALYLIIKRKILFFYLGFELFIFVFFTMGMATVGLYAEALQEKVFYIIYSIGILSVFFSSWVSYKMLLLFYKISEQKIFLYIIPFFIVGIFFSLGGGTFSVAEALNGEWGNGQTWIILSLVCDLIVNIFTSVAFLRTKLETLVKNALS